MTSANPISERVGRIFTERLNVELPGSDADLIEQGILDSLALVNFLLYLEQEFGLQPEIETLEFENFRTIERITEYVTRELAMRSAA
jgi:acyl carrier protein